MRNTKVIALVCLVLLVALGSAIALEVMAFTTSKNKESQLQNTIPFGEQIFSSFEESDDDVDFTPFKISEAPYFINGVDLTDLLPSCIVLFLIFVCSLIFNQTNRYLKLRVLRI